MKTAQATALFFCRNLMNADKVLRNADKASSIADKLSSAINEFTQPRNFLSISSVFEFKKLFFLKFSLFIGPFGESYLIVVIDKQDGGGAGPVIRCFDEHR